MAEKYDALLEDEPEFVPSRRFKRRMRRLIRSVDHPWMLKAQKTAAGIVAAATLASGSYLATDVEARETLWEWVKKVYEDFVLYTADVKIIDKSEFQINWLPDDYKISKITTLEYQKIILYLNPENERIYFMHYYESSVTSVVIDKEYCDIITVDVKGIPAELYLEQRSDKANVLTWTDNGDRFIIQGHVSGDDLVRMAESIYEDE